MVFRSLLTLLLVLLSSPAFAGFVDYPTVRLQALDKATARTVTLEAKVGTTIEYGSIFIKIRACREADPLDKPESAAFLQVWEVPLNAEKSEWVFSGWMFASSPALSAMDHPVYDVWVLDCVDKDRQNAQTKKAQSEEESADDGDLESPEKEDAPTEKDEDSKPRIVIEDEEDISFTGDVEKDGLSDVIDPLLEDAPEAKESNF